MRRILLVEDCEEAALLVKATLGKSYQVVIAPTASEVLQLVERTVFDLILMDVVLPDGDGFKLCAQLQNSEKSRDIPIIFLTGKADVEDKVMGFSLGADDYVAKPFNPVELRARVEAKLTKLSQRKQVEESIRKGDLHINVSFQKAYLSEGDSEKDLGLTPIEFKLLYYFARNEEHVLSREQLLTALWGHAVEVVDRTIDKHISTLRQKLGSRAHYIETVPRSGYRFTLPTEQARKAS